MTQFISQLFLLVIFWRWGSSNKPQQQAAVKPKQVGDDVEYVLCAETEIDVDD